MAILDPLKSDIKTIKTVERVIKIMTKIQIFMIVLYSSLTIYWIWKKMWILVLINYVAIFYLIYMFQKERYILKYWKHLKMYDGFDLKKAGE